MRLHLFALAILGCNVGSSDAKGLQRSAAADPPPKENISTFVPVENEPAPKLFVDAPLEEPLSRGAVVIPYRVENMRIMPVIGTGGANVSPRVGHLHVTVDDLPWHWVDASPDNTIVVFGLPKGQHKVLVEAAGADHHIFTSQTVSFMVPVQAPSM